MLARQATHEFRVCGSVHVNDIIEAGDVLATSCVGAQANCDVSKTKPQNLYIVIVSRQLWLR